MNHLAANIEYFLLSRNCVIVPSLGAFYAVNTPARWVDAEEVFLPPVRHIQFDPSITEDPDQYFIHALARVYGLTLDVARKRCKKMVEEFHKILFHEESCDFGSIGVFSIEDDLGIVLNSCECGIITPCYYGLDTLHFCKVRTEDLVNVSHKTIMEFIPENIVSKTQTSAASSVCPADNVVSNNSNDSYYTLRINKSVVNYAMSIAATIILFFIMRPVSVLSDNNDIKQEACPVMFLQPEMILNSNDGSEQLNLFELENEEVVSDDMFNDSYVNNDNVLIDVTDELNVESSDINQSVAETTNIKHPVTEDISTKNNPISKRVSTQIQVPTQTQNSKEAIAKVAKPITYLNAASTDNAVSSYCIVLASGVSKANAEVFISKLAKENINAIILEGEFRRVVIDGFTSYSAARQQLANLKTAGKCVDAWVLKK